MQKKDMVKVTEMIALGRQPVSSGSQALVADVLDRIMPVLQDGRTKPIGAKSLPKWRHDLGTILAGIMRPRVGAARAPRGHASVMWEREAGPVGRERFWRIADALVGSEFLGHEPGLRGPQDDGSFNGTAALLWINQPLRDLAAVHGVTQASRSMDWRLPDAPAAPAQSRGLVVRPWAGVPLASVAKGDGDHGRMAAQLEAINDRNASVVIRGAGPTATLFRSFRHSLSFGGRFYGPAYVNVPDIERSAITFDGEPCAEIDVGSAQLSLACGLAGMIGPEGKLPRDDLYALPGIPRAAAKAWTVRTLGRGTVRWGKKAWNPGDGPEITSVSVRAVEGAMLAAYPFLADLHALVPPGVLDQVPPDKRSVAAGQCITRREADTIGDAMSRCVAQGVPVLPVHDALIVPHSGVEIARAALAGAYLEGPGVAVRLKG